jgi:hypothetical protein
MRQLYSHVPSWAKGTSFDPYYNDRNQIAIKLAVPYQDSQNQYHALIRWMKGYLHREYELLDSHAADSLWEKMSRYGLENSLSTFTTYAQ